MQHNADLQVSGTVSAPGGAFDMLTVSGVPVVTGTQIAFRAYLGSQQVGISTATSTKVNLDTTDYNIGGAFSTGTSEFTAPVDGIYQFNGSIAWSDHPTAASGVSTEIFVDDALQTRSEWQSASTANNQAYPVADIVQLTAGQAVELRGRHFEGNSNPDFAGAQFSTFLAGALLIRL